MNAPNNFSRSRYRGVAGMAAIACLLVAALVVYSSLTGWPRQIYSFETPPPAKLPADADIAGWASFDRNSIYIGETLKYALRIVYRKDVVKPDLEMLGRSLTYGKFDSREVTEQTRGIAPGIREYTVEHVLQGVDVVPHSDYRINPAVLFYKSKTATAGELQSLRIQAPAVHVGGYYPRNVSGILMQGLKEKIRDPLALRRGAMLGSGAVLLALAVLFLWWLGRKRRHAELSEAERLWQAFHGGERRTLDNRAYLLHCESLFTRLLQSCTSVSPEAFWSGSDPEDAFWKDLSGQVREILWKSYRSAEPSLDDRARMTALLDRIFSSVVAEEALRREAEPSFLRRLSRQPAALAATAGCAALALLMLLLAARPAIWLSPSIVQYGEAVERVRNEATRADGAAQLADIGERIQDPAIKAAAFYNAGTVLANLNPLNDELLKDETGLVELFQDASDWQVVLKSQEELSRARDALRHAVVHEPNDESIRRNFELAVKRHRVVAAALIELIKIHAETFIADDNSQRLVDALNMTLQEDSRENEGKDDRDYYIGEGF